LGELLPTVDCVLISIPLGLRSTLHGCAGQEQAALSPSVLKRQIIPVAKHHSVADWGCERAGGKPDYTFGGLEVDRMNPVLRRRRAASFSRVVQFSDRAVASLVA
jgi:hypothetical protein